MGLPWGKITLLTNIFDFFCSDPKHRQTSLHRVPKPKTGRKKTKLWIEGENKVTKTDITYKKKNIYIYIDVCMYDTFTQCVCAYYYMCAFNPHMTTQATFPHQHQSPIRKNEEKINWETNGKKNVPCNQALQLESYLIIRNLGLKLIN